MKKTILAFLKSIVSIAAVLVFVIVISGCQKEEGAMEKAGKKVDEAVEKAGEKVKEGADKTVDAVKKDAEKVEEKVKK
jgi:hypothetical protein